MTYPKTAQSHALPLPPFTAPYAPDDHELVSSLLARVIFDDAANRRIDARATEFINNIRKQSKGIGGVEDFLREYGLSTREGLALMVLAEALLRVPDSATQDKLIEDKLKQGNWSSIVRRVIHGLYLRPHGDWGLLQKLFVRVKHLKAFCPLWSSVWACQLCVPQPSRPCASSVRISCWVKIFTMR